MLEVIQTKLLMFAVSCGGGNFFGFPKWYKYLDGTKDATGCYPVLNSINDVWLVGLAVVEIMLRVVALATIIFIIYGSFRFIYSRGSPEKIDNAKNTVVDALVGLTISVVAVALISFLARNLR